MTGMRNRWAASRRKKNLMICASAFIEQKYSAKSPHYHFGRSTIRLEFSNFDKNPSIIDNNLPFKSYQNTDRTSQSRRRKCMGTDSNLYFLGSEDWNCEMKNGGRTLSKIRSGRIGSSTATFQGCGLRIGQEIAVDNP